MLDLISHTLAGNLKRLREGRGLTQRDLASIAGVPRPTLAHIERGAANPTLGVLVRVAGALDSSIEELIGIPRADARFYEACALPTRARGGASVRDLVPEPGHGLLFERIELRRGGRTSAEPHAVATRRVLSCESGDISVTCGPESYRLRSGDVLVSSGELGLSLENKGRGRAVAFAVTSMASARS